MWPKIRPEMQPFFEDEKGSVMHCLERGVKMSGTVMFCTVVFNNLGVGALLTFLYSQNSGEKRR